MSIINSVKCFTRMIKRHAYFVKNKQNTFVNIHFQKEMNGIKFFENDYDYFNITNGLELLGGITFLNPNTDEITILVSEYDRNAPHFNFMLWHEEGHRVLHESIIRESARNKQSGLINIPSIELQADEYAMNHTGIDDWIAFRNVLLLLNSVEIMPSLRKANSKRIKAISDRISNYLLHS